MYSAGGERKVGAMRRESCQRDLQIFDSTGKKAGAAMGMSSVKILGSTDTLGSVGSKGTLGSIQ